jgi:hypothetical protein
LRFRFCDPDAGHVLTDRIQIYALQLPAWKEQREELLRTPLGPWMYFFNESSTWTEIPPEARIPAIQEATSMMYHFTEDERNRSLIEGRLRAERIEARAARTELAEERARQLEEKLQLEAQARQEEAQARLLAEQVSQKEAQARLQAEQVSQKEAHARLLAEQVSQREAQARQEEARARLLAEQARQDLERQLQELKASIARGTT